MTHWHEPVSGFQYETHSLNLSVETQAERLTACGIDPTIVLRSVFLRFAFLLTSFVRFLA
ncbi:MAG: hypothetical protein CMQ18_01995 [Gammaproteobacteria bacterium]|nr:hypothetical protein [Gammaproteobacteria bacterium]